MGRSGRLRLGEVRRAMRLVGECRDLGHDPGAWRPRLMAGVLELTGAVFVVAGEMRPPGADGTAFEAVDGHGHLTGSPFAAWREWIRRAGPDDHPAGRVLARLPAARVTRRRRSLLPDAEWYGSAFFADWLRPNRVDDGLFSGHRTAAGGMHLLNPVRAAGDRPFAARDARLLHLLQDELVPHLGRSLMPAGDPYSPTRLPPRVRQVLDALLDGDGEKQVAARLGLRRPTVHQYVVALYRHYRVTSRAELLARVLRRTRPGGQST